MKTCQVILVSLLSGILFAGAVLLIAGQPRGQAVRLLPPPTAAPLQVDVTGEVNHPGVYPLAPDLRIHDALLAAGGATNQADLQALNLAAPLADGMRIWVPGQATATSSASPDSKISQADIPTPSAEHPLNINTATQSELEMLPGIGETRAQAILTYRMQNGFFTQLADLRNVPGISASTLEKIQHLITTGP